MGIGHKGHDLVLYACLDRCIGPAARGPVCIDYFFWAKRRFKLLPITGYVRSEGREEPLQWSFLNQHVGATLDVGAILHAGATLFARSRKFQTGHMAAF